MDIKYKVTAIAHNRNFFTNPDRIIFEAFGDFDDCYFIRKCEEEAKKLLNMDFPMEMYFEEI